MKRISKKISVLLTLALVLTMFGSISANATTIEVKEAEKIETGGMREMDSSLLTKEQKELVANAAVTRGPAPGLTSIEYLGWFLDDNNYVHLGIREIGTSSTRVVKRNGIQRPENINEKIILWNSSNIAYGYIRFYNTGVHLNSWNSSGTSHISASYTNAMSPWNTLSFAGYVSN